MEEEGVFCVPEDIISGVLDLQVLFLELLDFISLIFVPAATQVNELLEGNFPIMDRKQQAI